MEQVHRRRPDEARDEQVGGAVVDLLRDAGLLQPPAPHHGDPVAERHRLALVVRHVDRRHREVALDPGDLGAHLDAQLRVEVRQRLVHQEDARLAHDRPAHRDPLPLAAGEGAGLLLQLAGEAEDLRRIGHAALDLALREAPHLEAERHVVVDRHVRIERVVLEDHRDVALLRGQVVDDLVADPDLAVGHLLEAGDHPERGRLAAAGGADEDHQLAVRDVEVERADGPRAVVVDLREVVEGDTGHGQPAVGAASGTTPRRSSSLSTKATDSSGCSVTVSATISASSGSS